MMQCVSGFYGGNAQQTDKNFVYCIKYQYFTDVP